MVGRECGQDVVEDHGGRWQDMGAYVDGNAGDGNRRPWDVTESLPSRADTAGGGQRALSLVPLQSTAPQLAKGWPVALFPPAP